MVLAEAFMKRNDLKKKIAELHIAATDNLWQDKDLPKTFTATLPPKDAFIAAMEAMDELQALNIAIAEANISNNSLLRELETLSARISLHESILQNVRRYPGDKVRDTDYSLRDTTSVIRENELLIEPELIKAGLDKLSERKREVEKKLAHNNFVTEVKI